MEEPTHTGDNNLVPLVTGGDIARNAHAPNPADVVNVGGWAQQRGFGWQPPAPPATPNPYSEKSSVSGDYLRRVQSLVPGSNSTGEFLPAYVPFESRTQLLVLTLAGGLAGVMLYSFFTRKPLIE